MSTFQPENLTNQPNILKKTTQTINSRAANADRGELWGSRAGGEASGSELGRVQIYVFTATQALTARKRAS